MMKLSEMFVKTGLGVLSTVASDGTVNSAIYARPHVIDEETMVWGMTGRRTYKNVSETGQAAFLFRLDDPGYNGVRLALKLIKTEDDGEMLAEIKRNADKILGEGSGEHVKYAAWFKVTERRELI
jgi:hypothetical protein